MLNSHSTITQLGMQQTLSDVLYCLGVVSLLEQSQIPDFQYPIVPPRHNERISSVPGDHINISVMCMSCQHTSF